MGLAMGATLSVCTKQSFVLQRRDPAVVYVVLSTLASSIQAGFIERMRGNLRRFCLGWSLKKLIGARGKTFG